MDFKKNIDNPFIFEKNKNMYEKFYEEKLYKIDFVFVEDNDMDYINQVHKNFKKLIKKKTFDNEYYKKEKKFEMSFKSDLNFDVLKNQINEFKKGYKISYYDLKKEYENSPKIITFLTLNKTNEELGEFSKEFIEILEEKLKRKTNVMNNITGFSYNIINKSFVVYMNSDLYYEIVKNFLKDANKNKLFQKTLFKMNYGNKMFNFTEYLYKCRFCKKSHKDFFNNKLSKCTFVCKYCESKIYKHECIVSKKGNLIECMLCKNNNFINYFHEDNNYDCGFNNNCIKEFIKTNRTFVINKEHVKIEPEKKEIVKKFKLNNKFFPKIKKSMSEESGSESDDNKKSYKNALLTKRKIFKDREYYKKELENNTSDELENQKKNVDCESEYESENWNSQNSYGNIQKDSYGSDEETRKDSYESDEESDEDSDGDYDKIFFKDVS